MTPEARSVSALRAFLDMPLDEVLARHRRASPEAAAIALFHDVAATVPAYGRFLAERGIAKQTIRTIDDFRGLPLITKQSYLEPNKLADLCRGGRLESCDMIAVSSGSTGQPTFWPRFVADELPVARRFEQVFHDSFRAHEKRTLAVVCFPLGTWVGGLYTVSCLRHLAAKGYPITVVAPGNVKDEISRVLFALGGDFEQVVLLGYPPFLKDVIDSARARGKSLAELSCKLVLAGEVVSESWRTLVAERLGGADVLRDFASLYGTADAGVLGNETPLSIAIRRFLAERPEAARSIFGEPRLPTLVQYDPMDRYFETVDGTLLFTGDNGAPLIRYHISDTGGIYGHDELLEKVRSLGFDAAAAGASAPPPRDLPFVYVFGRSHFTVSFFGANVFPENVTVGLEQPGIREWVTGKFVLESREDADLNRELCLAVELAPGEKGSDERQSVVAASVREHLIHQNSEFANYVPRASQSPKVTLLPAGDPGYFPVGVKHRYTRKA